MWWLDAKRQEDTQRRYMEEAQGKNYCGTISNQHFGTTEKETWKVCLVSVVSGICEGVELVWWGGVSAGRSRSC